jgi:bifunctional non-homologous end joining protein LigD
MSPARRSKLPAYRPQLAVLVDAAPSGPAWLHELKFDGYRIGCAIDAGEVRLISRTGRDWTAKLPEIVRAATSIHASSAVIDGEVTVVTADGRTNFQALQNMGAHKHGLTYFAFDLLFLNGRDLRALPLTDRKQALRELVAHTPIRYSEHFDVDGATMLQQACRLGAEGIVSKLRDAPYRATRNKSWLKIKCVQRQEFVIGGFTDPEGSRKGVGSILVGYYDRSRLRFGGKVGAGKGFTAKYLAELRRRFETIEQTSCPFQPRPIGWLGKHAHWVRPELVAEVQFVEWTESGQIRHPSFVGFREDKAPAEVVRELPEPRARPGRETKPARTRASNAATVGGVLITNPQRVLYPKLGLTKLALAQLYADLGPRALPHLSGRPLTLVRCEHGASAPDALRTECKFLPHSEGWYRWVPSFVRRLHIREQKKLGEYLVIDSLEALLAIVNGDILELHTWNATAEHLEQPDRLVFDLDPAPDIRWSKLARAALIIRERLQMKGLQSWLKTTGGKGLHVVVPLQPIATHDACYRFARHFAESLVRERSDLFVSSFSKAARAGKILIDYKRNHRTAISVAAFSTRARPDGTLSMPVSWNELDTRRPLEPYTVGDVRERIASWKADPWQDYWDARQVLTP